MLNTFENIVINDNKGYFFSYERNGLFELNLENWECTLLYSCEKYDKNASRLFSNLVLFEKWIFLIPMQADCFVAYNLKTKENKYIEIPPIEGKFKEKAKFLSAFIHNRNLYVIGHSFPGIIKIDLDRWRIQIIKNYSSHYICDDGEKDLFRYCKKIGNYIYLASAFDNTIEILNLNTEVTKSIKLECDIKGFASLFPYCNGFGLVSLCDYKIIYWDYFENTTREISINTDKKISSISNIKYSNVISFSDKEIIMPLVNNKIVVFDKENENIDFINIDVLTKDYSDSISPVRCIFKYNSKLFDVSGNTGEVFEIDINNKKLLNSGHKISTGFGTDFCFISDKCMFKEKKGYNFMDFVEDIILPFG